MAKNKSNTFWACDNKECDYNSKKYFGKCPRCEIGIGVEEDIENNEVIIRGKVVDTFDFINGAKEGKPITEIETNIHTRINTGMEQLNRVFGGKNDNIGIMPGSINVFYGRPGVGKSTLLLQLVDNLGKQNKSCYYISAEENPEQLKERFDRLGLTTNFMVSPENNSLKIKEITKNTDIIIIDSINTMYMPDCGIVGGTSQINANILFFLQYAKEHHKTFIIVGQVTKENEMAGTNFFKHMVDGVFEFADLEENGVYRIIQSDKNRFGSTEETAIMKMTGDGIEEVVDPSFIFINESDEETYGNAKSIFMQGNRPIFVEIESLIIPSKSEKKLYNAVGIDSKKYMQILAIIMKYLHINIYDYNIFSNVAGGVKLRNEPQIDLAILASMLSSINEQNINEFIFIGEVSLNGSIRKHKFEEQFIQHCTKMNINKQIICYTKGYKHIKDIKKLF